MIIVGITGGIGSGKSLICKIFESMSIPVYNADERAKALYVENSSVKQSVIDLLGEDSYKDNGEVYIEYIASKVFKNKALLSKLNAIIHPAVGQDFSLWVECQKDARYVLKEAAILIESGSYKDCDHVIVVEAPEEIRIQRVMTRDGSAENEVRRRIVHQISDAERRKSADFIIENDGDKFLIPQVLKIHNTILSN